MRDSQWRDRAPQGSAQQPAPASKAARVTAGANPHLAFLAPLRSVTLNNVQSTGLAAWTCL